MAVPLLDLTRQNDALRADLQAAFARVLDSGHFIMGSEVELFERECATVLRVKHAIAVSSGTDALLVSLMALGLGPGDEVICPSFTFFATAGSIARLGAVPVFADVRADSFNLDPDDVARRITSRTKVIMPVHLFGQAADMEAFKDLAAQHGIKLLEDAAQAFGACHKGVPCGGLGDLAAFSFFPSKNLGGFGDGGLVTTNDDVLADRVRLLRSHGSRPKYFHKEVGGNFRMDALQCALLRVKLLKLESYCEARRANARYYSSRLGAMITDKVPMSLVLPVGAAWGGEIWNQYTLRVVGPGCRDGLRSHLASSGIGSEIYYPLPLHKQVCFSGLPAKTLPVSEQLSGEVISIPVFPELSVAELDETAGRIEEWIKGARVPA